MANPDEGHEPLMGEKADWIDVPRRRQKPSVLTILPWALSVIFCCATLLLSWKLYTVPLPSASNAPIEPAVAEAAAQPIIEPIVNLENAGGSFEKGFSTDFVPTLPVPALEIKIVQKRFTTDLHWNATTQRLYNLRVNQNETKYIDAPQAVIEKAWQELLHDQYVAIEPEEVAQFDPEDREALADESQSYFELGVFHNLHCLNELRLAIQRTRSGGKADAKHHLDSSEDEKTHIDHCVDRLRQALECAADLTPVPMLPVKGHAQRMWLGNGEAHTCRDFDAIREWVAQRGKLVPALGDW